VRILTVVVILASSVLPVSLQAANLVQDPGFEAGPAGTSCNGSVACSPIHPAWTFTDAASGTDYGVDAEGFDPHSGTNSFFFAGVTAGSYDTIQQSLATSPGQSYTLTFWLDTHFNHSNADIQVFWNGSMVYQDAAGVDLAHQFPYTQITVNSLLATGGSTVLLFKGFNVPSGDYLDDISVDSGAAAPVPEPANSVLACAGALLLAGWKLLRRHSAGAGRPSNPSIQV
jgi:hypothetical protein